MRESSNNLNYNNINIFIPNLNNNNIQHNDDNLKTSEEIFHYNIILNNNGININYTIDKDAIVLILLADCRGILYKNSKYSIRGGDAGNISMGTSGLRPGQYILYINVNGRIYSRTINIR